MRMLATIRVLLIVALLLAVAVANRPREVLQEKEIGTVYVPDGNVTSGKPIKYALYEVYDIGRFLLDKMVFARVQIAQYWVRGEHDKTWRTVDLRAPGACGPEKTNAAGTPFMKCSAASVNMPSQCTPWNLKGCPVKLNVTAKNFVDATLVLYSGSVVVATRAQAYSLVSRNTVGGMMRDTPESGVFLANLTAADRLVVGDSKVYGPSDGTIQRSTVSPVETTQLSFAETFTVKELTSCHSYYVAVTGGRVLIASACRHPMWRAMIDFGVEYILFLIIVVVFIALGLLCGVCSFLYIRRRCNRKKRAHRALSQVTVENGQVPPPNKCSNKDIQLERDVDESAVEISVPNKCVTYSKTPSNVQRKKKAVGNDFWGRPIEHFKTGEPLPPPPDPQASTTAADASESGIDSEEEDAVREEEESCQKKRSTLFQSIRLLDFVKRAVADHATDPTNFKTITERQWSVIEAALKGLFLEENISPHYTGAFNKIVTKTRVPKPFASWTDYYKKKCQISLKHADLPMVDMGKRAPFPIPMELLNISDRRVAIAHSFDVVQCQLGEK